MPGVQGRSPERFLLGKSAGARFSGLKPENSTTVSHSGAILAAGENQYLGIVVALSWIPNEAFGSEMKELCL